MNFLKRLWWIGKTVHANWMNFEVTQVMTIKNKNGKRIYIEAVRHASDKTRVTLTAEVNMKTFDLMNEIVIYSTDFKIVK